MRMLKAAQSLKCILLCTIFLSVFCLGNLIKAPHFMAEAIKAAPAGTAAERLCQRDFEDPTAS